MDSNWQTSNLKSVSTFSQFNAHKILPFILSSIANNLVNIKDTEIQLYGES